jgi:hypothetical protein
MSATDLISFIDAQLRHQDDLIVARIGGLITMQAFIFYVYHLQTHEQHRSIAAIGLFLSFLFYLGILNSINTFLVWQGRFNTVMADNDLTDLMLRGRYLQGMGFLPAILTAPLFIAYWVFIEFRGSGRRKLVIGTSIALSVLPLLLCYWDFIVRRPPT